MPSGLWGMMRICSVIPHDSAAGEGAQIVNPLGLGTDCKANGSGPMIDVFHSFIFWSIPWRV
jgi:hypothetical protein